MPKWSPITPYQARILAAVGAGSRALEVATRSGLKVELIYPRLARMVDRRLVTKSARRPPVYRLTVEGQRQLAASQAYTESLEKAS